MNTLSRVRKLYEQWLQDPNIDNGTKEELKAIEGQEKELEDRFYKDLEFGTGGLRGVIGAGTNRMNVYTVGKATQGLAQYLLENNSANPSVAIAYDSRNQSPEFALESALVLAGNGIKAYLFDSLRTTPELSFAVRHLQASAGIVITASHNPPEYNGYKVYGQDGGQIVAEQADRIIAQIQTLEFANIRKLTREEAEAKGLLQWIGQAVDDDYVKAVIQVSPRPEIAKQEGAALNVVYTPLHGSGNITVRRVLQESGFSNVHVVAEQEKPDGQFSTVKSPNPEEREAFTLAIELGKKVNADVIIGTDPDCDRMGAVVKNSEGQYEVLTGNQSGAIMVHYLLSSLQEKNAIPSNGVIIKTIVTSEMGAEIARSYGVEVLNTLTGFKYIGEKMSEFEQSGEHQFLFGYEESYGYLAGTYARDKDAVVASMLICEAAAYYKSRGQTLYGVLQELYQQFGFYREVLESRTLKGKDGLAKIRQIMEEWRQNPPSDVCGKKVKTMLDYTQGINGLPKENVLKYRLDDDSWFCLRPSGTEPKIKVYFAVKGKTLQQSEEQMEELRRAVMSRIDD
ncbi:phospho-sugar mutase [Paenibacillus sp. J2TS4]|uniref:phospho-sugar mutase n=1 Tax=Paenibacillus sp. J2TS4 TaxID=2807194 RepID=UPI001B1332D3|nr:phospho-sugar mutase [Paenibacillus sp. J2TS4]GIP35577.1 phosphoglucomutase [Paenibacillus sp. J2TS4]